jgi:DNA-binding transcriptional LysR family regulator
MDGADYELTLFHVALTPGDSNGLILRSKLQMWPETPAHTAGVTPRVWWMHPWLLFGVLYDVHMELRHLRYFHAVVDALNFSRAAEKLRVAQPALSRQIRDLENELGVRLFNRNRVRVQLTDSGRTLATHAAKILAQVDIAVESVRATKDGVGGQLMICNDWRLSFKPVPESIAKFRALRPRTEIEIVDLPRDEHLAALRAGRAHVCFLPRDAVPTQSIFESMLVLKSEIQLLVNSQHPLAQRRSSAKLADFHDATFIRPAEDYGTGYDKWLSQLCRLAGFTPILVAHKSASVGGLYAAVGANLGVAILPEYLCDRKYPQVRHLASDCQPWEMHAVWLRDETSRLLREYLEILRDSAAQIGVPA